MGALVTLILAVSGFTVPRLAETAAVPASVMSRDTADATYALGIRLLERADPETSRVDYAGAAEHLYQAIVRRQDDSSFSIEEVFTALLRAYHGMGKPEALYLRIGHDYLRQGDIDLARNMGHTALQWNPRHAMAHLLLANTYQVNLNQMHADPSVVEVKLNHLRAAEKLAPEDWEVLSGAGEILWSMNAFSRSAEFFARSYEHNSSHLTALANAVYTRSYISDWGPGGTQYYRDMRSLVLIVLHEQHVASDQRLGSSALHPYMSLGYDIPAGLKLLAARSHAAAERRTAAAEFSEEPMQHADLAPLYRSELQADPVSFRIRVGYVSANIKTKTTVYMAQDLLRFHDRSRFEVHVYATTPPDTPNFLKIAMRDMDWRKKVKDSVEHFHEVDKLNTFQLHRLIRSHGIHILLNWDGYSNNGVRPTGLFAMQPAPVQIAHQEYIGTMGADYIQYMITDPVASPRKYESFYSEKFIWLPSSFLATSMAYLQPDMQPPSAHLPHPERRGCGGAPASFVYCNFNKQLKFDPHVFREWLRIMQSVPDSVLCLLENPRDSIPLIYSFVNEFDSSLTSRVRFQEFLLNPFDNQRRDAELCNAVLDTPRYNGHTTAADNLWAGVPIVAYGNSVEMGGRVGASILTTLGLSELIATNQDEYNRIAIRLAKDNQYYFEIRSKLVETCLSGKNAYWDLQRYMKNLENGFQIAFFSFLHGRDPAHIRVPDVHGNEGRDSRCTTTAAGLCDSEATARWPWADLGALDTFFARSRDDVARDEERYADITPEPQLNYHGVTQADIEEFSNFTLRGNSSRDIAAPTAAAARKKKRRRRPPGDVPSADSSPTSGKRAKRKATKTKQ